MNVISYTAARQQLAKTMDDVCQGHDPIIITRGNTEPVVMISLEDFNALQETAYLLKSPANAARLAEAVDEIEAIIANKGKKK
ncbi:MAG: type II toxin-antitoxin system prevent-host-death family antitoxin [Gammaproteobacteria bacterium]|nr:type II toxin-antitoxin system prevent-host-death family antitoxin [Gammaproteobacteria bacterium]